MGNRPYLTHDDPNAFVGMEKRAPSPYIKNPVECPKCHGYGHWHLSIDEYGPGRHFDAHCGNCNGYGWVEAGSLDATCIHEYEQVTLRMFTHKLTCRKCGTVRIVDSSD